MAKLKLPPLSKRRLALICVAALLAGLSLACFSVRNQLGQRLQSQLEGERYRGDSEMRYVQVSAFFPEVYQTGLEQIYGFRQTVEAQLTAAGVEASENGVLWTDGWYAEGSVTVRSDRTTASSVTAYGVGEDWFLFHPLTLRSGSYIYGSDLMHDRVVINEALAWQLFGGMELTDMPLRINDELYYIAGVVSTESDWASSKVMEEGPVIYMAFDALTESAPSGIVCYELVCAEPLSGFTLGLVEDGFEGAVTVQNTGRFSPAASFKILGDFGLRSVRTDGTPLPYWENAARFTEDWQAALLLLSLLLLPLPLCLLVWALVRLLIKLWRLLRDKAILPGWEKLSDNARERSRLRLVEREKRYGGRHAKKSKTE